MRPRASCRRPCPSDRRAPSAATAGPGSSYRAAVTEFLQHLVNGVSVGTIYALIALGYTMVYGVLKLINFAHGDVYMVGAFAGYYLAGALGVRNDPTLGKAVVVTLGAMVV